MRVKTTAVRVGLAALLILLASSPLAYQYLASMASLKPGFGGRATAIDFASAPESSSSADFVLAYAGLASQSVRGDNYTEAKRLLGMIGGFANTEHDLGVYLTLLNGLVLILDSLKFELDDLQVLVNNGAVEQANEKIRAIEGLISDGSKQLDLLVSSLDRIQAIYAVDVSKQKRDLEVFSSRLTSLEQLFENLRTQVGAMDRRTAVRLDLQASPNPVQVEGSLHISGKLEIGGTGLGGRVIELWINGIETANVTLGELGTFDWEYLVSSNARVDKVEVYATYSPTGDDIPLFRPAKSTTVTVPVNYYPVLLTITLLTTRVHVLENFTVQGYLTDSLGRALPAEDVRLLIDEREVNDSVTNMTGMYSIATSLPAGTIEGEHQVYAQFQPRQGIYASAISNETAIQLYYLRPTITQVALSRVGTVRGEPVAISGQMALLEGRLEVDSKPFERGLLIASLAGNELGRGFSQTDGVFRFSIRIPYDASGDSQIEIVFVPAEPWVAPSTVSTILRVLNSVMLGFGVGATVLAILVFSGKPIDPRSFFGRRRALRRRLETETIVAQKPERQERSRATKTMLMLADFKVELDLGLKLEDPRAYVKSAYLETKQILAESLGLRGETSETPREYNRRVADGLGAASSSLTAMTQLFEIAEYSQHVISRPNAQEARDHAVRVTEEVNMRMKR